MHRSTSNVAQRPLQKSQLVALQFRSQVHTRTVWQARALHNQPPKAHMLVLCCGFSAA